MPSINLAPGTEFIIAARKRRQRLYVIAGIIIAIAGILFLVLFLMEQSLTTQDEALKANIQTADAQIQKSQADALRVSLFEKRLTETKVLLDAHVKWDQVFADLEHLLPPATVLTNIDTGTDSSTMSISGSTPDIDTIAQTIASLSSGQSNSSLFRNGQIKNLDQKSGDQAATGYKFSMSLTLDSNKLQASAPQ